MHQHSSLSRLNEKLSRVSQNLRKSATLPPQCYADESIIEVELARLFDQSWISVGRTDRWTSSGSYSTLNIGTTPIIIIRNNDNDLKAFANSCRHRGSTLLQGDGDCKKIRCPFHCWTYDLNGKLIFTPRMECDENFQHSDYPLIEFRLDTSDGFLFINMDGSAPDLTSWLGDFSKTMLPWDMRSLASTRVREFDVDCNWKTFIEVFNEYYHLPYVHPSSLNWLYPEPDGTDDVEGNFTSQFGETNGNAGLLPEDQNHALPSAPQLKGRELNGTRYTWVYPNLTFATAPDTMWMYETFPIAANKTRIIQTICFPKQSVEADDFETKAQHYYNRFDEALAEDIPFLEQQQKGLSSKYAQQGQFSVLEPSVANFAYWYANKLKDLI